MTSAVNDIKPNNILGTTSGDNDIIANNILGTTSRVDAVP